MTEAPPQWRDAVRRPLDLAYHPLYRFYLGGGLTQAFRGLPDPRDSQWSEDWVGSVTTAGNCDPDGRRQGLTLVGLDDGSSVELRTLVEALPTQMLGRPFFEAYGAETGLLVKILSPAGTVPLHAHPTRAWAREHLGSPYGKTEAWILLDTPGPDDGPAYAGIGFREHVTREWFREAVDRRDVRALRDSLHRTTIAPGEVYVAAGGVPHLLGPRELFIEVQEPTDHIVIPETDDLDDGGATMGLGWDEALDMLDYTATDRESTLGQARQSPRLVRTEGDSAEYALFASWVNEFFDARRFEVADEISIEDDRFSVLIVTAGSGLVVGEFGTRAVRRGDALAMPACVPHRLVAGETPMTAVRCLGPTPGGHA